jgi:hypothetical protein
VSKPTQKANRHIIMIKDPEIRPDGRCTQCGKPKARVRNKESATVKRNQRDPGIRSQARLSFAAIVEREAEADPFCSTECCKAYYGVNYQGPMNSWVDSLSGAPGRSARGCKGCRRPLDWKTEGCMVCYNRHQQRKQKAAKLAPSPA